MLLAPAGFADIYRCANVTPPVLIDNETAQAAGQPECTKKTGFSEFHCPLPESEITSTYYDVPDENNATSWQGYQSFFNCLDAKSSAQHTIENSKTVLVCHAPEATDEPPGCCAPVASTGAVNVNGSGITKDGRVVTYAGNLSANTCAPVLGGPTVMSGASHKCLIPFISVACDVSIYPLGTIFSVPELKGTVIHLHPDGKNVMIHPGYVICQDTGSGIKGPGRFDFYSGTYGAFDPLNIFGSKSSGDPKLEMKITDCRPDKSYTPINLDDPEYERALTQITQATGTAPTAAANKSASSPANPGRAQ